MPSPSSTRLERALELFLRHQAAGGDWQQLLARHADLADVLVSFVDEAAKAPDAGAVAALEPGPQRLGDFELGVEIGRGGLGIVYEARQRSLNRRVALKILHNSVAASPLALARFRREASTLARLDHPNIVRVFAVGEDEGRAWLAMEFVEGESLAARIDRVHAVGGHRDGGLRELVVALAEIAAALQHAHEAGIVHRDVKPSNILLRADGSAVLSDFGLARDIDTPSLTQTGVIAGTPHYMAPEQIVGGTAVSDARVDVFAFGATLYECLTLQRAFEGGNTQAVLHAVLHTDPIDPRRHWPGMPTPLVAITQKALEKDAASRYQSARGLSADLRAFLELREVSVHPISRTRWLWRRLRRKPLLAALACLALCTVLLGAGMLWQLPQVRAAAAARAEGDYEDALVTGLFLRTGRDAKACYAQFERALAAMPGRAEAIAALCLCMLHFEGPAAALAELERRVVGDEDAAVGRCRLLLLRRLHRDSEAVALEQRLGPPDTPFALWLAAVPLTSDIENRSALLEADRMLSLALRTSPRPRLLLWCNWAAVQVPLDDREGRREAAESLLQLWPDHALALRLAGANLLTVDAQRAKLVLQQALARSGDDAETRLSLGVAEALTGQREHAVASFEAAARLPGLVEFQRCRAVFYVHQLHDPDAEQRIVDDWLRREPASVGARAAAARIASRDGDHERAIGLLRGCIAAAPGDYDVATDLGFALVNAGDPAAAESVLERVVREKPTHERAHLQLLDVLDAQADEAGALVEHERWAGVCPTAPAAWQALAEALATSDAPDAPARALAAAERADYLADGKDPTILTLRADALLRCGFQEEAARLHRRVQALPK